jgi:hypothetical protein
MMGDRIDLTAIQTIDDLNYPYLFKPAAPPAVCVIESSDPSTSTAGGSGLFASSPATSSADNSNLLLLVAAGVGLYLLGRRSR